MAANRQLTPLAVAALGLLAERAMHPYEMYQLLIHRREDRLVKVKPGTLYHTVDRLAENGLVKAVCTEREGNRPERTTYAILPAGRQALELQLKELLAHRVAEYPSFPQAVAEAHNLPAGVVLELLDQRMASLAAVLAELDADTRTARAAGVAQRFWMELLYQQTMARAELDWVRELHTNISTGALPWLAPELSENLTQPKL